MKCVKTNAGSYTCQEMSLFECCFIVSLAFIVILIVYS